MNSTTMIYEHSFHLQRTSLPSSFSPSFASLILISPPPLASSTLAFTVLLRFVLRPYIHGSIAGDPNYRIVGKENGRSSLSVAHIKIHGNFLVARKVEEERKGKRKRGRERERAYRQLCGENDN